MPQKPTAYYRPTSLDEALQLLRQPNTVPLAGGTDLLATEDGTLYVADSLNNAIRKITFQ